ncbi:tetratricopeptide repeat protein [Streptomyces sp. SID13031]|uniref:AfsR/SARP family transcriptional regulator n=1 Tax=Streptomyces sp. SID13031 TaxID=2706046 RepID=UPI0013C61C77|nr:tetratricopeptide repeat protein [Streptomyces sp. SID13031]NEA32810.1 tetratricopeptide repeat protein [Streptomyces sp. SID13031]
MEFRLLGPFEAWHNGSKVALGDPQQRFVLVVLLLNAGRPVSTERLVETVWPNQRPKSPLVPGYISKIRALLRRGGDATVENSQTGYVLHLASNTLDTERFAELKEAATGAHCAGDLDRAAHLLQEAIDLWRGDFLEDLDVDRVGGADVVPPEESLIDVVGDLAELKLADGNHRWVRDRVRPLLRKHPENNHLAVLLMRALLADGDRVGAIQVYREAVDEVGRFGMKAPPELRELAQLAHHQGIRNTLPRRSKVFTDRAEPLREVAQLAGQSSTRLVWVNGPPGVGKTTFAVEAAHQMATRFTGGLLFASLNGFTLNVEPVTAADALAVLLRDLGVPEERIPKAVNERALLYQERLAGTQTLVVLDNAASDEHVRLLLPDAAECFAIVTSRRDSDLLDGGTQIRLSPFSADDGATQFRTLVDTRRLENAGASIERIVTGCGGLPLNIRLAAAQFSRHDSWPIAHLATLLEQKVPWRADADSADVSAILVSYRHLDDDQRAMFRLCGLAPGADLDLRAAAALADCTVARACGLLDGLHAVGMLEEQAPERYYLLDPLKEFARSVPAQDGQGSELTGVALDQLLDFFLVTTHAAVATAFPFASDQLPVVDRSSTLARTFADREAALGWLAAERANLVTIIGYAAGRDRPDHTWQLAVLLWRFLYTTGRLQDWLETLTIARCVTARQPDSPGFAQVLLRLSAAYWQTGQLHPALEVAAQALPKWVALGDVLGQADTLVAIAAVSTDLGNPDEAIAHLEAALAKYIQIGDRRGQANALSMLGHQNHQQGEYLLAAQRQRAAADLLESIGNFQGLAHALDNLGSAQQHLGDLDDAMSNHERAHSLAKEHGDLGVAAYAVGNIGNAHRRQRRLDAAVRSHQRALKIAEPLGDPNLTTLLRLDHGETCLARRDFAGATRLFAVAAELATETGDIGKLAQAHLGLARTLHEQGRHDSAIIEWNQAESAFTQARLRQLDAVQQERKLLPCACAGPTPLPAS